MSNPSSPQRRILREGDVERRQLERLVAQGDPEAAARLERMSSRVPGTPHETPKVGARYTISYHIPPVGYSPPLYIGLGSIPKYGRLEAIELLASFGLASLTVASSASVLPTRASNIHYVMDVLGPNGQTIQLIWANNCSIHIRHNRHSDAEYFLMDLIDAGLQDGVMSGSLVVTSLVKRDGHPDNLRLNDSWGPPV